MSKMAYPPAPGRHVTYTQCSREYMYLGLQQRIDKIDNRLLKALATNLVIDSLSRAINTSLVGTELLTDAPR